MVIGYWPACLLTRAWTISITARITGGPGAGAGGRWEREREWEWECERDWDWE